MKDRSLLRVHAFSEDRAFRYTLWREWDVDSLTGCADDLPHGHQFAQFIGLNPSTADETRDDPTIRRCIGFAKLWGYGALCMTNLFAFRATKPRDMRQAADPIGPENMALLPPEIVDWENGPWPDDIEQALHFLQQHLTELAEKATPASSSLSSPS